VSVTEWKRHREIQRSSDGKDLLTLGYSTFFLNRTNRSGIICSGGLIGGLSQRGKWKLNARYNKSELINRIERIASLANKINLYRQDAAAFLRGLLPRLSKKSFLYLDPPYYVKGTSRLYANFYGHREHVAIASLIGGARVPWLVSYDDQPEIRRMYRGFRSSRYHLSYTARDRYDGREVLFFSDGLEMPSRDWGK
jgi:DNA adenine methylase